MLIPILLIGGAIFASMAMIILTVLVYTFLGGWIPKFLQRFFCNIGMHSPEAIQKWPSMTQYDPLMDYPQHYCLWCEANRNKSFGIPELPKSVHDEVNVLPAITNRYPLTTNSKGV